MWFLRYPALSLSLSLALLYGVVPAFVARSAEVEAGDYLHLSKIAFLAAVSVMAGSLFYQILAPLAALLRLERLRVPLWFFSLCVWGGFAVFVVLVWSTAESIPALSALSGADPETVAYLRERFLKARDGSESSYVYINALLCGALLPYSLGQLFINKVVARWALFAAFLVYCLSFLEKAFFFKAMIPLFYLVEQGVIGTRRAIKWLILACVALLVLGGVLAGSGGDGADGPSDEPYFSARYHPNGVVDHLVWRSVAVPIFTAADSLTVLRHDYPDRMLMGATSGLFVALFGVERVELERDVFAYQWGQNETGTGSSNSAYLVEAYANFGYPGVMIVSLIIGMLLGFMTRGRDLALAALWPLFAIGVFTGGFFGVLLSNGFILVFLLSALCRFDKGAAADGVQSTPRPPAT